MVGHALRVVAGRSGDHARLRAARASSDSSLLSAPRSLNDAVNWWFSNLRKTSAPVMPRQRARMQARRVDDAAGNGLCGFPDLFDGGSGHGPISVVGTRDSGSRIRGGTASETVGRASITAIAVGIRGPGLGTGNQGGDAASREYLRARCKISFRRVLSANSPTGCSPKSTCHGSRLRARRGGPVRGHPRAS